MERLLHSRPFKAIPGDEGVITSGPHAPHLGPWLGSSPVHCATLQSDTRESHSAVNNGASPSTIIPPGVQELSYWPGPFPSWHNGNWGTGQEIPSSVLGVPKLLAGRLSQRCARTVDNTHRAILKASAGCPLQEHAVLPVDPQEESPCLP